MTTNAGQRYDQEVVDLLKALGRAYLENGENQRAADKFRQLVNNGIEDSEILTNFALVLARSELITEEALSIYKKSVAANETDEGLYLTLATLFLKKEVVEDPALKVYRRSLKFSPPFEEEIRTALERVFRQSTKSIDIAELRQTLLDCGENPELLSVYLTTAWRESKFDDALTVLKDLYQHSHENPNYLKPICETLLEKKARSEENGLAFEITPIEVQLSLKFQNLDEPLRRIADLEIYLDLKNLFLNFKPNGRKKLGNDEYEFFILDKSLPKKGTNSEGQTVAVQVDPIFDFERDFIQKLEQNESTMPPESAAILNRCNTLGIFEIANFDANPDSSKLPFVTFLKSISAEMNRVDEVLVCPTGNGIITLNSDPDKLVRIAVVILQRLQRYNQVVDDSEKIKMRVTAHSSLVPFVNLEKA
ncbi:MAG TPA: tetratricopeptide repeat protein, partial [bacterium]